MSIVDIQYHVSFIVISLHSDSTSLSIILCAPQSVVAPTFNATSDPLYDSRVSSYSIDDLEIVPCGGGTHYIRCPPYTLPTLS